MTIRRPPNASGDTQTRITPPLRSLMAVAPSGAAVWLVKFTEHDHELGWGCGNITDAEYPQFRKARGLAEKAGVENWMKARAVLLNAGWTITNYGSHITAE